MNNKSILMAFLLVIGFFGMGNEGCDSSKTDRIAITPKVEPTSQVERVERFTIKSYGTFRAGYDNEVREIFVMKDNSNGDEYIGITDCSLIKRIKKAKEAADEAAQSVIDAATSDASSD